MEKQYSVEFFQSLVDNLQDLCRSCINFSKFVEVTGYISIEIDNARKERYVLSEMIQNNGQTLSESYCIKAFKTCYSWNFENNEKLTDRHDGSVRSQIQSLNPQSGSGQRRMHVKRSWLTDPRQDVEFDAFDDTSVSFSSRSKRKCLSSKSSTGLFSLNTAHSQSHSQSQSNIQTTYQTDSGQKLYEEVPSNSLSITSSDQNSIKHSKKFGQHRQEAVLKSCVGGTGRSQSAAVSETVSVSGSQRCNEVKVTLPHGSLVPPEDVIVKPDPEASSYMDEDTIDLDMYDHDDQNISLSDLNSFTEDQTSQEIPLVSSVNPGKMCRVQKGNSQNNPYIEKVTRYAVKKLSKFCFARTGQHVEIFSLPPVELDSILSSFFNGLRKKDGDPYDPRSLRTMQCNIDKHLKNGGYAWSILKDRHFSGSRDTLKTLLGEKSTNKPQFRYDPLTEDDIETLFVTEQLGANTPESLLNSMWLLNSNYFGIKSLTEHFHLKWSDLVLLEDDTGQEYLQHMMKGGHLGGPKVYAKPDNPSRCFVHLYKAYSAKRPMSTFEHTSSFYLNISKNIEYDGWFSADCLSWYKLASLWKKMVLASGLPPDKKPMLTLQMTSSGFQ